MFTCTRRAVAASLVLALTGTLIAAGPADSLKKGDADIKHAGALAFGPDGILFVGDSTGAAIFAIDTGDNPSTPATGAVKVEKIDEQVASALGTKSADILINDMAVNPASGNVYLSVSRGKGPTAAPVLLKVDRGGKISELPLKDAKFAKAALPNPPAEGKQRADAITSMSYVKGHLYVAGLSNEEFASKLRVLPFPFAAADKGTSVEIYHGSHGKFETRSPVRTFTTLDINGETHILAAYTCTPLVKFPLSKLKGDEKVRGVTIAELGNQNRPLDMITYKKGDKDFLLMANNKRGVMKLPTDKFDKAEAIEKRVPDKAGVPYETIKDLTDVQHLAKLDKDNALVLKKAGANLNLETVPLP